MQNLVFLQAAGQLVVGDARIQVVDVVEADVAAEPLQNRRKLVIRAALQPGFEEVPVFVPLPEGAREVVLHIEQPDADRRGNRQDRDLYQQHSLPAYQPGQGGQQAGQRQVGVDYAPFFPFTGPRAVEAV